MAKTQETREDGKVKIYCAYITRGGKKIPPPKGQKCWTFWVYPDTDPRSPRYSGDTPPGDLH